MLILVIDIAFVVATDVTKMISEDHCSRAFFGYFRKYPIDTI